MFGCALLDQFNNDAAEVLWLHNSYGEPEEMPLDVFFRDETEMPLLEQYALSFCKGKILDVGAGAGCHSLALQKSGRDVTALEISATAAAICKKRGVNQIVNLNLFDYYDEKYDTLLMMTNGIGLAGSLNNLPHLLQHCKKLMNGRGQIIFDTSDISYLYDDIPYPTNQYFGNISFQYEYKHVKGDWFNWLYVDKDTLNELATENGFGLEILFENDMDQYLGRLSLTK